MVSSWIKPASTLSRGGSHMTAATSHGMDCRSADCSEGKCIVGTLPVCVQVRSDSRCVFSVSQDVLYPVEAVVLAGGYMVHQVTAADSLKTGDQVQLHLDQVNTEHKHVFISI